jgi:Uma2 family endonuclease
MSLHEIVLPETKPETEWLRGRAVRKMSPRFDHGVLQAALAVALHAWAKGKGKIATEWRFRVAPPGGAARPIVPDISFVRNERLRGLSREDAQVPLLAPDLAFEILSPGNKPADVADKIDVLLRAGTRLVVVVDPMRRVARLHDASGVRTLPESEDLEHEQLEGLRVSLAELFAELQLP